MAKENACTIVNFIHILINDQNFMLFIVITFVEFCKHLHALHFAMGIHVKVSYYSMQIELRTALSETSKQTNHPFGWVYDLFCFKGSDVLTFPEKFGLSLIFLCCRPLFCPLSHSTAIIFFATYTPLPDDKFGDELPQRMYVFYFTMATYS